MRHFIKHILLCSLPLGAGLMYADQDNPLEEPSEAGRSAFLDEQRVPPPHSDNAPYHVWADHETPPPPPRSHRGLEEKSRYEYNYPPRSDRSYAESHARKAFKKDKKCEAPYKFSQKRDKKFRSDKKGAQCFHKKSWKKDFAFNCLPSHHFLHWNDCKTEYCCEVELAGAGLENLEIFVENFELVIQTKVKRLAGCDIKGESCVKVEKKLEYRLIIPRDGDLDKIQVLLINGLLDIKLPKFKSSQIKKIFVH